MTSLRPLDTPGSEPEGPRTKAHEASGILIPRRAFLMKGGIVLGTSALVAACRDSGVLVLLGPPGSSGIRPSFDLVGGVTAVLDKATFTYDPANPSEPDPAMWTKSGTISPVFGADTLVIVDPDSTSSLLYFHDASSILSALQNNRTAGFRVALKCQDILDTSPAFDGDIAGGRIILDDGTRRAELQFGRDPTANNARIIRLGASATGQPIAYKWDRSIFDTFEISRACDGKMTVTITSSDPNIAPVSKTYVPGDLAPTNGSAMFAFGVGDVGGGAFGFREAICEVDSVEANFAAFMVTGLQVRVRDQNDKVLVQGTFTPAAGQATDPSTQDVSLTLRRLAAPSPFWPTLFSNPTTSFVFNGVDTYSLSAAEKSRTQLQSFDIRKGWSFNTVDTRTALPTLDYTQTLVELRIGQPVGAQLCRLIENPVGSGNWKLA